MTILNKPEINKPEKKIMILAGEASGDKHGAEMARAMLQINPKLNLLGMGSKQMQAAGVAVFFDSSCIAVMGIVEIVKHWGNIKKAMAQVKDKIESEKPDLLICIDYQEFNQKMASHAKSLGVKVLFYISPQIWAWRPKRVKKIGRCIDQMAVIFPFEVDFYTKHHIPVTYVGHPLLDKMPLLESIDSLDEIQKNKKTVGLFPGSRQSELTRVLPIMLKSALRLKNIYGDDIQFVLPVADSLDMDQVKKIIRQHGISVSLFSDNLYRLIKSCDAIISCSGTVTLEIALLEIPLCVVYKLSWLTHQIMSRLMIIDHFCLVNIVAKKLIVKEFLQHDANAQNISKEIEHILDDRPYTAKMKQGLMRVKQQLGEGGGSKNIAQLALKLLK